MSNFSRREFLAASVAVALTSRFAFFQSPLKTVVSTKEVEVTLIPRVADAGREVVSFGLPLPPDFLSNPARVKVVDERGNEVEAAVRSLEPWRLGGKEGTSRSVLIQFNSDFTGQKTRRVRVLLNSSPKKRSSEFVPVNRTLLEEDGLKGPRVLAVLPAKWLCDSWIVGPQVPASGSGAYSAYDQFVERNFPGSLAYIDSKVYHEWLYDRPTNWYKMYVRTGDRKFLEAAYQAAHFMRLQTEMDGANAGIFKLKGADLKYVYPRAMHLHYLLTGDERALEAGRIMAQYCLKHTDPVYRPANLTPSPLGTDPERNRSFWSLRHQGYGLLGILHGWEMTGDRTYWTKAQECVDAYYRHQTQPPDGRPPDGSLRQNWSLYDPNEASFKGATSAWMMALLLDPLFMYWTMTGDKRVPEMVVRWCDFLDRQGMLPDGSKAYYVINCFAGSGDEASPGELGPDMEMHNPEVAYTYAMGIFFSDDPRRRAAFRKRFEKAFSQAVALDVNRPARAYSWAFQFSSQLVYFMQQADRR